MALKKRTGRSVKFRRPRSRRDGIRWAIWGGHISARRLEHFRDQERVLVGLEKTIWRKLRDGLRPVFVREEQARKGTAYQTGRMKKAKEASNMVASNEASSANIRMRSDI